MIADLAEALDRVVGVLESRGRAVAQYRDVCARAPAAGSGEEAHRSAAVEQQAVGSDAQIGVRRRAISGLGLDGHDAAVLERPVYDQGLVVADRQLPGVDDERVMDRHPGDAEDARRSARRRARDHRAALDQQAAAERKILEKPLGRVEGFADVDRGQRHRRVDIVQVEDAGQVELRPGVEAERRRVGIAGRRRIAQAEAVQRIPARHVDGRIRHRNRPEIRKRSDEVERGAGDAERRTRRQRHRALRLGPVERHGAGDVDLSAERAAHDRRVGEGDRPAGAFDQALVIHSDIVD